MSGTLIERHVIKRSCILVAKNCAGCGELKLAEEFHVYRKAVDGRVSRCRDCLSEETTGTSRKHNLKRCYGMTPESYDEKLEAQGGHCAICPRSTHGSGRLAVDHDHACCPERKKSCGACVRGLLCDQCNNGLGRFFDSPELLRAAAAYLESYR